MTYFFHLLIIANVYVMLAVSLNIVAGYGGYLSLSHATFFAFGGYAYALATLGLGCGFLPSLLVAIMVGVLASFPLSLLSWRFRGDVFVMVSLAFQAVAFGLLYNWNTPGVPPVTLRNLTNGPFGLSGIPRPAFGGIVFDTVGSVCALSLALTVAVICICWILVRSPWGRLMKSIRDDELAVKGLGKPVNLVKVQGFAFSCAIASVSGALYCGYIGYIDPSSASLDQSILLLSMVVVGGLGNLRGPILGALILVLLPELLRSLSLSETALADVRIMVYGLLLVAMMHFRPQGIAGVYRLD